MVYFFIFIVSFIAVYLSTPSIRYVALRFAVLDKTNQRKIHTKVVAKLGGLAIYFGFLSGLAIAALLYTNFFIAHIFQIGGLVVCSTLILMLGVYDDFQGSGALIKFFVQIIIAAVLVKVGFRLERIFIPGIMDIKLGILGVPLTILWLVGMTNAVNLIDGLDGLAAGVISVVSFFFFLYGALLGEPFVMLISLALLGANLAFLRYNFYPAKIFMGDTGSLFLGFIIGSLAIYRSSGGISDNVLFIPSCVLLFFPILDTSLAIIRRVARRRHVFKSDFSHIHHYYVKLGFSHTETVKRFYAMTFFLGIASLSIIYAYIAY